MSKDGDGSAVDEAAADELAIQVMTYNVGLSMAKVGYLGRELGLYEAMRGAEPASAETIAKRAGLHPRWVLEWLRCQAAAGLVTEVDGDRFELNPTQAAVVIDESSRFYRGEAWKTLTAGMDLFPALVDSFRTGVGALSVDDRFDPANYSGMLEEFQRERLVPEILPAVDGAIDRLNAGGSFVDVGCGRGVALLAVAKAFPSAKVYAWDPWTEALDWCRTRAAEQSVRNIEYRAASVLELPSDGRFDIILMADCVHHLPDPVAALRSVRGALARDGALVVIEFRVDAIRANPVFAAAGYAASILGFCLNDGMPEGGGAGLGLLGFDQTTGARLTAEAGFSSFRALPVEHWMNVAYELRP